MPTPTLPPALREEVERLVDEHLAGAHVRREAVGR